MGYSMIYVTASSLGEAESIGRSLCEKRLAACVNIIPHVRSLFWWEGRLCTENEVALIAKTRSELVPQIIEETKRIHSYQVPVILEFEVKAGNSDFFKWVDEALSGTS